MKKILFAISSLQIGGAETVMVDLVNNLYDKFDITILLAEKRGQLIEKLNPNIKLKYLTKGKDYCANKIEILYNKIKLSAIYRIFHTKNFFIKYIYKKILKENYDVEIAFLVGLPSKIISKSPNKNSKKIAWIHATVEKEDTPTYNKYMNLCDSFDDIIGVSEQSIKVFEKTYPESKGKIQLIHNYIDINKIIKASKEKTLEKFAKNKTNFISVGRLVDEKGFDRILKIAKNFEQNINFYIIGDGPLKEMLTQNIKSNNINNVHLLGLKPNPFPYIKMADAFIMPSRSEAYPTVLLEALILEKFIIATKVSGVTEILENYNNKIIIENKDNTLEKAIVEILKNKNKTDEEKNNSFIKQNNNNLEKIIKLFNK